MTTNIEANGTIVLQNDIVTLVLPALAKQSVKMRSYAAMDTKCVEEMLFLSQDKSKKVVEALLYNRMLPSSIRAKVIATLKG